MANRFPRQTYNGGFIGYGVRRSLGGDITFRVRRGNGYYGSILGHRYQDKFTLVIPSSINNKRGEPYRVLLAAAVAYWKDTLSAAEKKKYNRLAGSMQHLTGYNLFVGRVIKGDVILPP